MNSQGWDGRIKIGYKSKLLEYMKENQRGQDVCVSEALRDDTGLVVLLRLDIRECSYSPEFQKRE